MSQYLQLRDCSGLVRDCPCPNIYRSGSAQDWSGIAHVPIFTCPGLLLMAPGLPVPIFTAPGLLMMAPGLPKYAKVQIFAGPGLLGIGPGLPLGIGPKLPMSQHLQVRDCSGLLRDCPCPNIYRSGIARDCSRIAHVPRFTGPGLLGIAPGLRIACVPIFTGPGLAGIAPGLPKPQFLQVRDCSGLVRDCPCPNIYRSGIARDWSGIAHVPIFTGPGLLGIAPGLPTSQYLHVRDCSGLVWDCPCPNIYRSGIARDCSGIAHVPIFTGPGLLLMAPGLPVSQYLRVRDCS
jgi:RNA polymerase subunit RPABC4/transcription elongation factor Spt4